MMVERSTDRVAIITGASRGIGAGLVDAFRTSGYRVIANSRTIGDSPDPEIRVVAGDIADPATAQRLVEVAVRAFGRIDTLVNNAGVDAGAASVGLEADAAWWPARNSGERCIRRSVLRAEVAR
jgi:NAD(P)-dependent dehydrogenase (short-subunit alcohol dehydrogenase family)